MSYRKILLLLTAVVLFPLFGSAQNKAVEEYDAYVAELKARCPIEYKDDWGIRSFKSNDDTTRVELQFPSLLVPCLSALTVNTENARKLWVRQMHMFGEDWAKFERLLLAANRTLVLDFVLEDEEEGPLATMTFLPEDFNQ